LMIGVPLLMIGVFTGFIFRSYRRAHPK
jgi:hypothetical protein